VSAAAAGPSTSLPHTLSVLDPRPSSHSTLSRGHIWIVMWSRRGANGRRRIGWCTTRPHQVDWLKQAKWSRREGWPRDDRPSAGDAREGAGCARAAGRAAPSGVGSHSATAHRTTNGRRAWSTMRHQSLRRTLVVTAYDGTGWRRARRRSGTISSAARRSSCAMLQGRTRSVGRST